MFSIVVPQLSTCILFFGLDQSEAHALIKKRLCLAWLAWGWRLDKTHPLEPNSILFFVTCVEFGDVASFLPDEVLRYGWKFAIHVLLFIKTFLAWHAKSTNKPAILIDSCQNNDSENLHLKKIVCCCCAEKYLKV